MRSHVVLAVFKRNFWSYFSGVIGYLFIIVFVVLGALAAFQEKFFTNNVATLDQLNELFPRLLLFIVPAITMAVWSEERKLGTEELLFTLPVSDFEVLIGKYLAVISVYSVALLFSLTHVLVLFMIGQPDPGILFTTYLGYWLAGCALLSAGMVASYMTNSATVAFVLGFVICLVPVFVNMVPTDTYSTAVLGSDQFFDQLSVGRQLEPLGIGLIPPKSVLYFASIAVFMLYLNLVLIGQRHWSGGTRGTAMGLQYLVRAVSFGLILISLNVLANGMNRSVDLTAEHVYSVSRTTRDLLSKLSDKRPVTIQAFVSRDVPRDYVSVKTTLLGLLGQFEQSTRNVSVRIITVDPASAQAEEAKKFGIEGRKVQSERAGRVQVDEVFLGIVINSGANEVVVPFLDVGLPVEYELTRSVWTVAAEKRKTIGVLETDAKVNGGFDMSSFRSNPEWRIVTELKKQYNVETVSPAGPIDDSKYDVVMAVLPSSLTQNEMRNFVDYVKKGKPVLIFDDPLPATNPGLAPRQPKPKAGGNPMMQMGMPSEPKADNGKALSLISALGIEWASDQVIFDQTVMTLHPEWGEMLRPEIVSISPQSGDPSAFNQKSEITKGMQEIFLFFSGSLKAHSSSKLEFTPLLETGKRSGVLKWDDLVKSNFMGGMQIDDDPVRMIDDKSHIVAAEIQSPKDATETKIHAIYVADSDLISDWFFMVRERKQFHLNLDNVTFVLNAVDHLAGDSSYIELRNRRSKHRTLTAVEKQTARYIEQSTKNRQQAADEAKKALDEAKKRLEEKVEKIKNDSTMDEVSKAQQVLIAQQELQRRLEVEETTINQRKEKSIEQSKVESERNVRAVEGTFFKLAILISLVPSILLGSIVLCMRLAAESKVVAPERRRTT